MKMDGANADSDHSMTWEDFFGSTTDLTPTLIGIYDSLLEPEKSLRPESNPVETAKDARNDPPVPKPTESMTDETENNLETSRAKDPTRIAGGVKLPLATLNKSSLYSVRTVSNENESDKVNDNVTASEAVREKIQRTFREKSEGRPFENLSPNVKRMISSAAETSTLKFQKKSSSTIRSSGRHKSNIPLVGATSKISQSGVEILPSVEIYDQPFGIKAKSAKTETEPAKPIKPEFKLGSQTYDVPTNNRPAIYDVPITNKNSFDSLSLPYIDSSMEISITCNDREFDTKLSPKDSPKKEANPQEIKSKESPTKIAKINGTNSLHRKDFKNDNASKNLSKIPFPETIGSTGNLKSCAIPENEVVRLNPPSVEVSRPLSMSSIASSSSTSSSGVQNKGVNSAYLASIESLDDHSDDLTSANGSNNFVNKAGILNAGALEERSSESPQQQASDETSGLSQLERVCAEIVQTENVYVEDLRQVVEGYLHIWRSNSTFSSEELSELFNNIEDIYLFNRALCEELNTCRLDATCIARCFVNNTSGFSVYTSYCTGYPCTMERLAALASNSHSAREFRERQIALGHPLPLASYLLKPVQRILKYHLLLQNVVKQCASSETQYALLKMTGIAQHIDDMKRRHEHAVRVQEIQSLLYGWNGPDLTTYGELCAEGTFRVFGAKAMRHAFLFDKMLLVTKNREDGILAYKSHIMCNNMMLVESIAGAPLSFHVIPWDAPRAQLTLQARSARHKREWTLLLKRVILENYNAVIPSHARQLVMELGQNKTDDDILAEKSHNLITQASMRKQLSAPEYLEKRKLERERRKSFENGIRGRLKKPNRKYTLPNSRTETQECDCAQVSAEKGTDYTCDSCYVDLCSDCESELNKDKHKDDKCGCRNENNEIVGDKCPECDRTLHYIDSGSAEHLERKQSGCKCSDFKSSQESFSKEFTGSLNKNRGYHSSDNIFGYTDSKNKDDVNDTNNSLTNVRNVPKTCLKCAKIKENIVVNDSVNSLNARKSRCTTNEGHKTDTLRSKSKDDPHRSKLSKIGTWRRKSEPGLQQNNIVLKKSQDSDCERNEGRGNEKIEFECRNCGSNKITRKVKISDTNTILSDPEIDTKKHGNSLKSHLEIQRYNTKNIPKKITKLKKNRTKGLRFGGTDTTAKFYADLSTDVSTENILHISESNDSLNIEKPNDNIQKTVLTEQISKDEDIDEETYKKLIEKTDSFKKNELEKVKFLNKQKVINEGTEADEKVEETQVEEETEQPLEQIISQLLMQNREFQKLLKKQQLRNSAQRRHQRLLKSHSNPEQVIIAKNMESNKIKAKYGRQTSENLEMSKEEDEEIDNLKSHDEIDKAMNLEDDHIYETLRVESKADENSKSVSTHIARPRRLPSPPKPTLPARRSKKAAGPDSDYVYLSFDKLNTQDNSGIYDVPIKSPEKVVTKRKSADYYVTMENQGPPKGLIDENVYDNLVEVRRRNKDPPETVTDDYLPMGRDLQSPNAPEIWLSRQKEHFNVSRDRKSGSLPRSFQVITNNQDENNLSTFKCKPNSNSKTYLNREGKVMSIDRPFTIASDQSEISYDDVENYMSEGDILKFNKRTESNDSDIQDISKSTLELEEELDRCYKTNIEANLDKNKNESLLRVSQQNTDTTLNNSCEVLPADIVEDKSKITEVVHPEHKIYKPTSNVLSLKNVLSRFRNRTPNKNVENVDVANANDESSPDSNKSDLKSPTNEKRSALNPRSYSKNLLHRFRSIIGDDPTNDNQNKSESHKSIKSTEDSQNNITKNEIKVVITSTDHSPTTSSLVFATNNDTLSKSVCDHTTLTESQNEKINLESLSHSCDNITHKPEIFRPNYEKSVSMVTNISSPVSSVSSKSNTSSYHSLNKLPIYMQGSKHLGARIAQADYVDPTTLVSEKSTNKNFNVLINKNAVRPDSLFSNSSFVTSSSEGTYQDTKTSESKNAATTKEKSQCGQMNADESYYEKTFEKIENVIDEDVFRDSAVYSDQEDGDETKTDTIDRNKANKTKTKIERVKSNSFKSQKVTVTSTVNEKNSVQSRLTVTTHTIQHNIEKYSKINDKPSNLHDADKTMKSKIAPPVPVKPKITNIPSAHNTQGRSFLYRNNQVKSQEEKSSENITAHIVKTNTANSKPTIARSESTPAEQKDTETKTNLNQDIKENEVGTENSVTERVDGQKTLKPPSNIHMKRLNFERASLDSATRKTKPNVEKRSSIEPPKVTSKSVLERRLEIEQLSKYNKQTTTNTIKPVAGAKNTTQIPKPSSITTKVATFERSVSESKRETSNIPNTNDKDRNSTNDPNTDIAEDLRGSWVKQVVNKFQ